MKKSSVCKEKSFAFAVRIVRLSKYLRQEHKEFTLSKQILRSGTSIGANVSEAEASLTKKEFSAKISIAYKEASETDYWIELLHETDYLSEEAYLSIKNDCTELCKILFSILKTTGRIISD